MPSYPTVKRFDKAILLTGRRRHVFNDPILAFVDHGVRFGIFASIQ